MGKEKVKLSLFTDYIIIGIFVHLKHFEIYEKPLELAIKLKVL